MKKFAVACLVVLGFVDQGEAYRIRKWSEMYRKKELTETQMNNLVDQYTTLYTLGFNSIKAADEAGAYGMAKKFELNLQDVNAADTSFGLLRGLQTYAKGVDYKVD